MTDPIDLAALRAARLATERLDAIQHGGAALARQTNDPPLRRAVQADRLDSATDEAAALARMWLRIELMHRQAEALRREVRERTGLDVAHDVCAKDIRRAGPED
ncbi:MAG: hypothetical protein F4092_08210 [Rhodospirillaceae bacterium]|nr:hypothetical protein [Rhodospirillaceae bacterium]MYF08174.1 hypothetical protein [Rhodospirillaceae bacterium]MYJ71736.1 hypothetical protein [Rhodospirillaceae bacterium]